MRRPKQGTIYGHEKSKQRRSDLVAAEKSHEINEGKVRVPVYGKKKGTYILVPKYKADSAWKRYRLAQANDPANERKVAFLQKKGWHMRADGIWLNRFEFLQKDFETALIVAKYYEHLTKEYQS